MKKLYRATFEVEAIVAADDSDSAEVVARQYANQIFDDDHPWPMVSEFDPDSGVLPHGWDESCIPFGADNNDTIAVFQSTALEGLAD